MLGNLYLDNQPLASDAARIFEEALADSPQQSRVSRSISASPTRKCTCPKKRRTCFQHVFAAVACPPDAYIKLAFFQLEHKEVKRSRPNARRRPRPISPRSAQIRYYQAIQHRYEKNYTAALAIALTQVRELS